MMKKKTFLIPLLVLLAIVLLSASVLVVRSDFRFLLEEKLASFSRSADVEKINCAYTVYSVDELSSLPNLVVEDSLLLINEQYVIASTYEPHLVSYKDVPMSEAIVSSYVALSKALYDRYETALYIRSSYRTPEEQAEIVESSAEDVAAAVGSSEHQTGLSLDVYVSGYAGSAFIQCDAGRYVNRYAWQYGFIIRYPFGSQAITGITYEPWHIRYVGAPHAELIYQNSLTLEEYITEFLLPDTFYAYGPYILSRQKEGATLKIPDGASSVVVSPDNTGYVIVTAYFSE